MLPPAVAVAAWTLTQVSRRRPIVVAKPGIQGWFTDSKNAVLIVLLLALVLGGGRKVLQSLKARKAVEDLDSPEPCEAAFIEAAKHGRAAVVDLFRILGSSTNTKTRDLAGKALSVLWKADELIAEEEKAIVSRGYVASWKARRRYPRGLVASIPIEVEIGVPFLAGGGLGVAQNDLEWSFRILGSERVSLETYSAWQPGPLRAAFAINPRDYDGNGPHRLVLQARVRTTGSTTPWSQESLVDEVGSSKKGGVKRLETGWELELPHVPFSFEFDSLLTMESLFATSDEARNRDLERRVILSIPTSAEQQFLLLNSEFAIRDCPCVVVEFPLPCDLAHTMMLEIEGYEQMIPAGTVVVVGQSEGSKSIPLTIDHTSIPLAFATPGQHKGRVHLTPDPQLGWATPEIRSIWPESFQTAWIPIRLVRT